MIKAFRADDRLIHGQVQTQWISTYGVNRVMIIDSNVVRQRKLLWRQQSKLLIL